MDIAVASLLSLCKHQVDQAVSQKEVQQHSVTLETLTERVADIVTRNLNSGRAQRVMGVRGEAEESSSATRDYGKDETAIAAYIDRVITTYLREHERVEKLAAQDDATWFELCEQLTRSAYHILLRRHTPAARAQTEAPDFAQQACEAILTYPFPYDVSFDAWATVILRHRILQRYTRSSDLMDRRPDTQSLDRSSQDEADADYSLYTVLTEETGMTSLERVEARETLLQAIAQLPSQAQQQVIVDSFLYELTDDEITVRLNRTKQAVYNLRHRALRRLKKILNW